MGGVKARLKLYKDGSSLRVLPRKDVAGLYKSVVHDRVRDKHVMSFVSSLLETFFGGAQANSIRLIAQVRDVIVLTGRMF